MTQDFQGPSLVTEISRPPLQKYLQPFVDKVNIMKMITSEAAELETNNLVPDGILDFVYVDAPNDYCGAIDDIRMYWPNAKAGRLVAGHDLKLLTYTRVKWMARTGRCAWTVLEMSLRCAEPSRPCQRRFAQALVAYGLHKSHGPSG